MDRITDAWKGLGRREQVLAVAALGVVFVVSMVLLFTGDGGEVVPVDGSDAAASAVPEPVDPSVAGETVGDAAAEEGVAASTSGGAGVAPLAVAGGGGGDVATGGYDDLKALQAEADRNYVPDDVDDGVYVPPVVSDAVKAAGRDLEAVALEYRTCWVKAKAANADLRPCMRVLKYGVYVATEPPRNGGIALTKQSSDGHRLDYVLMPPPQDDCRVLDQGESCDAWVSR